MAEALGLASGVIAVVDMATKVGGASIKLKRLWNEVKDAPNMLLQKAAQVQDFEEFLIDTEGQIAKNPLPATAWNSSLLQKYIGKARKVLSELQEMIDDLLDQATAGRAYKRRIGSTKAVLRKDNIKALDDKLTQALNLFKMAQGQYMIALINSSHILNLERDSKQCDGSENREHHSCPLVSDSNSTQEDTICKFVAAMNNPAEIFNISHEQTIFGRLRFALGSNERFQLSWRTPNWFSSSVYSMLAFRSTSGWQVSLRAYEVVKSWVGFDDLRLHFWNDDPVAMFRFLDEHRMTPFVRDERGHSLLRLACHYSSVKILRSLLKSGLTISASENINFSATSYPWLYFELVVGLETHERLRPGSPYPANEIIQLLKAHGVEDEVLAAPKKFFIPYLGSYYIRPMMGDRIFPFPIGTYKLRAVMGDQYLCLPIEERLRHARDATAIDDIETFSSWLPELKHDLRHLLQLSRAPGVCSFVHTVAYYMARDLSLRYSDQIAPKTQLPWFKAVLTYISLDPEGLSHVDSSWERQCHGQTSLTPFCAVIRGMIGSPWKIEGRLKRQNRNISSAVRIWVTAVSLAGMDALQYGRSEKQIYQQRGVVFKQRYCFVHHTKRRRTRLSLIGITYGSRPEQWRVWWAWEYEDLAGDFWQMIEEPGISVPGGWVEDSGDAYDVERDRLLAWQAEEPPPLIWSEYRKIRPPV